MSTDTKPGWKTTEFWGKIAVDAAATALLIAHRITPTQWTSLTGGTTAIYALARTVLKKGSS